MYNLNNLRIKTEKEFVQEFGDDWREEVPYRFPKDMDFILNQTLKSIKDDSIDFNVFTGSHDVGIFAKFKSDKITWSGGNTVIISRAMIKKIGKNFKTLIKNHYICNMKLRITAISDTHSKHKQIASALPGGDLLVHSGDISSYGYKHEVQEFAKWFNSLDNYTHKIFIAGNHDFLFQNNPQAAREILEFYDKILYIQDNFVIVNDKIIVYGAPWQPEFHGWAFNLPRVGDALKSKWELIPEQTDILLTHGPAFAHLDVVKGRTDNLGCELLAEAITIKKPKLHICGHIHSAYGYKFDGYTHYINAAVLDEQYVFTQKPITFDFDFEKNEIEFL